MDRALPSWVLAQRDRKQPTRPRDMPTRPPRVGATPTTFKPLRPTPNIIGPEDLKNYADELDTFIQSLNNDVNTQVSTGSADELNAQAAVLDAEADKIDAAEPAYASELRDRATAKRALAAKATPANLDDQKRFAESWSAFMPRWNPVHEKYSGVGRSIFTSGADWTTLQAFDVEYQSDWSQFVALGLKPTMRPPPPPPDTPGLGNVLSWLPWIIGGAIVLYGLVIFGPTLKALLPAKKAA